MPQPAEKKATQRPRATRALPKPEGRPTQQQKETAEAVGRWARESLEKRHCESNEIFDWVGFEKPELLRPWLGTAKARRALPFFGEQSARVALCAAACAKAPWALDLMDALIEAGANMDVSLTLRGSTALACALAVDNEPAIRKLLPLTDLLRPNQDGETILAFACLMRKGPRPWQIEALLAAGADPRQAPRTRMTEEIDPPSSFWADRPSAWIWQTPLSVVLGLRAAPETLRVAQLLFPLSDPTFENSSGETAFSLAAGASLEASTGPSHAEKRPEEEAGFLSLADQALRAMTSANPQLARREAQRIAKFAINTLRDESPQFGGASFSAIANLAQMIGRAGFLSEADHNRLIEGVRRFDGEAAAKMEAEHLLGAAREGIAEGVAATASKKAKRRASPAGQTLAPRGESPAHRAPKRL